LEYEGKIIEYIYNKYIDISNGIVNLEFTNKFGKRIIKKDVEYKEFSFKIYN